MKVTIIYFSQTDNTRRVAGEMAKAFREAGHTVRIVSLKKASPQDAMTGDLLGIGAPCFASQAPTSIKAFLHALPELNHKPAFVFATSGGDPGRVLSDLSRLLQSRGAEIVGGFLTRGELHHPAPCMIGRMHNRPNVEDLSRAHRFAIAVAEHTFRGCSGLVTGSRTDTLKPRGGFYDFVGLISTDRLERLLLPQPQLDENRCDQCKWCVYECPVHNIALQPYPVIGKQCIRCYRCLTGCPQEALEVNWFFGNLILLSFYNTKFESWFGDLEHGESIY